MNKTITKMKQLGVSFESAPVELPVDTQPVAELPEPELTNDELVVIAEADAAQATHDQLSALATTLESMAAADGMSDTEAALFGHAREAIVAGTPLEAPAPAMESFGTAAARLNNAQVALEDVNSKLKAAGEWIRNALGELVKAIIKAIIKAITLLNELGHRLDKIEWPKWWNDAEYIWLPRGVFIDFGIGPDSANFESIERVLKQHLEYATFFESSLTPELIALTRKAVEDYKSADHEAPSSTGSSAIYDEQAAKAAMDYRALLTKFFGQLSNGEVPDEKDYYHLIRKGLVLPGGFRWKTDPHDLPRFDEQLAVTYVDGILWMDKPQLIKIKVPTQQEGMSLLGMAIKANNLLNKGIDSLNAVMAEVDSIHVRNSSLGGDAAAIRFRLFISKFNRTYFDLTSVHSRYARKATKGIIDFFRAKSEDNGEEHA